jgi:hypothetical protein
VLERAVKETVNVFSKRLTEGLSFITKDVIGKRDPLALILQNILENVFISCRYAFHTIINFLFSKSHE